MMSLHLAKELFNRIKRVINRPLAIVGSNGQVIDRLSNLAQSPPYTPTRVPNENQSVIAVESYEELQAIPIYYDNRLYCLVVSPVTPEDSQTIQVITSLAELLIQQFVLNHKPQPDAVDLLLTRVVYRPGNIDPEELEQQVAALGYRLDVQRCALVIQLTGFWENYLKTLGEFMPGKDDLIAAKKRTIDQGLSSFFSKNQDNLIGYVGNDNFLVLKDLNSTNYHQFCQLLEKHFSQITNTLKNTYITEVSIGVGAAAQSTTDLLLSAHEALQALTIGQKIIGSGRVYRFDSLGMLPLLLQSSGERKSKFAEELLQPLDEDQLYSTLLAFLSHNLNLTETAEALGIHRNTVIYRLDRIEEKIGRDPRQFEVAVELFVADFFRKVQA